MSRDVRVALFAAWIIISTVLFSAAVVPFVIPDEWLLRFAPVCEAKKRGASCALCGMTTAYVAIGRSDFAAAHNANAGSLAMWSASIVNFQGTVAYVFKVVRKRRKKTGDPVCK